MRTSLLRSTTVLAVFGVSAIAVRRGPRGRAFERAVERPDDHGCPDAHRRRRHHGGCADDRRGTDHGCRRSDHYRRGRCGDHGRRRRGAMLPPNATLEQIEAAVIGAFGPTTDVAGELAPFVDAVPAGIPTPEGAVVEEVSVFYYPNPEDLSFSYYSSTTLFTSAVPAPDLVAFYQSGMPAAGFVQTGDSVQNDDGRQVRLLTYDVPSPVSDQDEVSVIIVDESSTTEVDFVQLEIDYGLDPATVQMYAGWPAGMPLIEGVPVEDASMTTFNFGGDVTLNLSNGYNIPVPPDQALTQFEAGLAGTGYTIDPDSDPAEGYFDVVGGELGELTIFLNDGFPEGTTSLSIDSSFDIVAG